MFCTMRRYESIDQSRTNELVKMADESLLPKLSELPGFSGYYLIEAGNGVMSSIGFFDTSEHAEESTRIASNRLKPLHVGEKVRARAGLLLFCLERTRRGFAGRDGDRKAEHRAIFPPARARGRVGVPQSTSLAGSISSCGPPTTRLMPHSTAPRASSPAA
jgi:hypothetical protein